MKITIFFQINIGWYIFLQYYINEKMCDFFIILHINKYFAKIKF